MSLDPHTKNDSPRVRGIRDLIGWFSARERAPSEWKVGIEHEKIPLRAGTLDPVPYQGPGGIAAALRAFGRFGYEAFEEEGRIIAAQKRGLTVSIEPGGQIELSGRPFQDVHVVAAELDRHLEKCRAVAEELGLELLATGYRPWGTPATAHWMPKARYLVMRPFLAARGRHVVDDGGKERGQIRSRRSRFECGHSGSRVGVQDRKLDLRLGGIEIDEQVVHLVEDLLRPRVRPVDLVQHHDGREPALERLPQDEPRLRQRPFRRVDQQHHAVDHRQRALDFSAEIGMARRVDDVDQVVAVMDGGVLGEDGDPSLPLEVGVVHHAVGDLLMSAKGAALAEQRIDERRLAVIDVRHDGHVAAERVGHESRL